METKKFNVVIANEAYNFTATKYNTTLTGFTSFEAASNAAREALRDIAGEMGKGERVFYSEILNAWILASARRYYGSVWLITAKIVEVETEEPTETEKEESETLDRLKSELQEYHNNASKGGADRERNMQWLQEDIKKLEQKKEAKTTVTVSITEDGNKCEYTANGKVLASIVYRKEFDKYDVNTPSVGYMTDNITEAHKACESGINHLLNTSAVFDYSAVERFNAVNYPEAKTIEVEIYHDGNECDAIVGDETPAVIGWVDRWANNTFAAEMQFGVKVRKAIAIEGLTERNRAHRGFMSAENAKLWLVDQIKDYFSDHGYNLKVFNL